jgi:hypothetical protein
VGRLAAFPQVHGARSYVAQKKGPQLTLEAFGFCASQFAFEPAMK